MNLQLSQNKLVNACGLIAILLCVLSAHLLIRSRAANSTIYLLNRVETDSINQVISSRSFVFGHLEERDLNRKNNYVQETLCLYYDKQGHLSTKEFSGLLASGILSDSNIVSIKFYGGVLDDPNVILAVKDYKKATDFLDVTFKKDIALNNKAFTFPLKFANCKANAIRLRNVTAAPRLVFKNIDCDTLLVDSLSLNNASLSFDGFPRIDAKDKIDLQIAYQQLIKYFDRENDQWDLKKANIAYNETFESNPIYSFFSNYGYEKSKIVWITIYSLWITFFVFLFVDYRYLHIFVYPIPNLHDGVNRFERRKKHLYYSILYLSIIFFSVNIKFENIRYSQTRLFLAFILIYLWGLICLAFMVNFIVGK